ncbi:hypothetical protein M514_02261 [Trichuris suis]|uniref:Uncharacterized protein n=1 Tax=Trichuris suis TaxID=68888 RepID=A0A085MIF8_9BILA|nr:hypothetical protein M513_02261 [Trichuris suis]KFD70103.1 hypothetical protein M514_02261 [Trichuris suis]KHJ47272.1 hypothetical protein D918_02132 [Trichuris suis]
MLVKTGCLICMLVTRLISMELVRLFMQVDQQVKTVFWMKRTKLWVQCESLKQEVEGLMIYQDHEKH